MYIHIYTHKHGFYGLWFWCGNSGKWRFVNYECVGGGVHMQFGNVTEIAWCQVPDGWACHGNTHAVDVIPFSSCYKGWRLWSELVKQCACTGCCVSCVKWLSQLDYGPQVPCIVTVPLQNEYFHKQITLLIALGLWVQNRSSSTLQCSAAHGTVGDAAYFMNRQESYTTADVSEVRFFFPLLTYFGKLVPQLPSFTDSLCVFTVTSCLRYRLGSVYRTVIKLFCKSSSRPYFCVVAGSSAPVHENPFHDSSTRGQVAVIRLLVLLGIRHIRRSLYTPRSVMAFCITNR